VKGETARVARVVQAYRLLDDRALRVSVARVRALEARIAAVLPQLSIAETNAYYAALKTLREIHK